MTDSTGSTCFSADYYPYGQEIDYTTSCSPTYKFTGYEFDSETGNYYAYARYYSPRLGRFMSPDLLAGSILNPQTLNGYAYVLNNPETFIDPLGLSCTQDQEQVTNSTGSACITPPTGTYTVNGGPPPKAPFDYYRFLGEAGPNGCGPFGCLKPPPPDIIVYVLATSLAVRVQNPPARQGSLSQRGQVCEAKVQNDLSSALGVPVQFKGPELDNNSDASEPGLINGAYNFNFFVPGVNIQVPGVLPSCGRFDSGLHIIVPVVCNPSGDPFMRPWGYSAQMNGSYITAHIDSADPFADVVSFFTHIVKDVIFKSQHGC